ncbi:hypothetical protein [Burkholderia mayonis]|uniref:hypothetical protein n=1 Tax=Burkholderia mayonis TaxID=1385591 RepID=UPI00131EE5AB|nr:hypothetical protein [Burkholderia mayonis]
MIDYASNGLAAAAAAADVNAHADADADADADTDAMPTLVSGSIRTRALVRDSRA